MFLIITLLIVFPTLYYTSTVRLKHLILISYIKYLYMQEVTEDLLSTDKGYKDITAYLKNPLQTKNFQCVLRIMADELLVVTQNRVKQTVIFQDYIGYSKEALSQEKQLYKFTLNSYAKQTKGCTKKVERRMIHQSFWVYLNSKQLQELEVQLLIAASNRKVQNSKEKLKFLIYLNPNAGANSSRHFQAVQQFLRFTNFSYELIETTHRGHCQEHLNQIDLTPYQGVVIISGDGLMHEFVNSKACGRIPVTHVPGGSGNAFSKAQTTLAKEECRDEEAMFLAVKGNVTSMNLVKMQLEKQPEPIYSFLSLEWAFLADIDMNSQFLRCCGGLRFEVYAFYKVLALHRYPARLTFSTSSTFLPPLSQPINHPVFESIQTSFLNAIFLSIPFISDKYQWGPLLKVEDQAIDMQYITQEHGRWELIKYLLSSDNGDHFDKQKQHPKEGFDFVHKKLKSYRLQPLGQGEDMGIFGIDGERYQAQRIQASISNKKILTFT